MKTNFRQFLMLCIILVSVQSMDAQIDTIVIKDHAKEYTYERPQKKCIYNKHGEASFDSLRIYGQVIHKVYQSYYLIIKDSKGRIRHEGQYFDKEPDGKFIDYMENGTMSVEGQYEASRVQKNPGSYCIDPGYFILSWAVCLWTYYDGNGNIMDQHKYAPHGNY